MNPFAKEGLFINDDSTYCFHCVHQTAHLHVHRQVTGSAASPFFLL